MTLQIFVLAVQKIQVQIVFIQPLDKVFKDAPVLADIGKLGDQVAFQRLGLV
jgi:hypothetical protein